MSASFRSIALILALSVLSAARAAAHDAPTPPEPIETVEGTWPAEFVPTYDAVVQLFVTVSEAGVPSEPTVDVSVDPALDAAALTAALQWRFKPALLGGNPIAAKARIAVRFRAPPRSDAGVPADAGVPMDAGVAADAGVRDAGSDVEARASDASTHASAPTEESATVTARAEIARPGYSASTLTRSRALLAAAPHRTANDMLAMVPGLFVTQHGGEGKAYQIFYRGFDAVHGQDLELWVGGAPVNDVSNIHGQGYADLHFVMPEVVRALHATPGSYDPRQGDFAVAGTVRLELGYDQPGLTAKGGYGSYGSRRFFLAYRPPKSGEGTFAAAEFYDTDGFGPARAAQRASAVAQWMTRFGGGGSARLMFSAYTGHFDSAGVLRLRDIQSGVVGRYATYDPNQGGASSRVQLVGELARDGAGSRLQFTPYVVLRSLRLRQNFTGYLLDPNGDSQQQLNGDVVVGGTAFYRLRRALFSERDQFEVGISARSDWVDQSQKRLATSDQRVTANEVDAQIRALDVAGYVDVALHPLRWLTVRGGVRLDGLSYLSVDHGASAAGQARASQGLHVGKKGALQFALLPGLDLVASYGEGFRSPQARSLAESEKTPFTNVRSTEVGMRYGDRALALSAAGFRTWLSDDLVFDQSTARNERVPATQRTGVTVDATWQPKPWATLNLNATYTRAEFRGSSTNYHRGDLVPYAPQIVSRADVAVSPVVWEWSGRALRPQLGAGLSYLGRRPLPYAQLGHHILLVDAQASLRFGELGLSLRAFNLLDAKWYDGEFLFASNWDPGQGASLVPMRHVTVGAPRTFFASVEVYL
ncbi:MAG TPA: TonB-dependent receptor [Polyangiales bacterium]